MNSIIFTAFALCIGTVSPINAGAQQATDEEHAVVYTTPLNVQAGSTVTLSVMMDNSVPIQTFQFDVYLPEGMSFSTDEFGPLTTLNPSYSRIINSFGGNILSNGALRILGNSTTGQTIPACDAELAQISIEIPSAMPPGDYTFYIKDVVLVTKENQDYRTASIESSITVTGQTDSRVLLDENATELPDEAIGIKDVRVKRTLKGGEWSTIVLPFDMTTVQVQKAFRSEDDEEDVLLADFAGYEVTWDETEENVVGITVNFNNLTSIIANRPCLIKVPSDINEFTVDGVNLIPEDEPINATVRRTRKQWSELIGTYVAGTVVPELTLFITGNRFYYSMGSTVMKGYRAYFDFYDVLTSVENEANQGVNFNLDAVTGISDLILENRPVREGVFTLQGVFVGEKINRNTLPSGIYIVNGKKIFVR